MEKELEELADHNLNIEVLIGPVSSGNRIYGIRCRPFGRGKNTDTMVLAGGENLAKAVSEAHAKAKAGRFEPLDWSKRPWSVGGKDGAWGPDARPSF